MLLAAHETLEHSDGAALLNSQMLRPESQSVHDSERSEMLLPW